MDYITCSKCGARIEKESVYCRKCGEKVNRDTDKSIVDKNTLNNNVATIDEGGNNSKGSKKKIIILGSVLSVLIVVGIIAFIVLTQSESFYEKLVDKADEISYKRYEDNYVDVRKSPMTTEYSCTSQDISSRGKTDYDYYITENKVSDLKKTIKKYIKNAKKEDIDFYNDDPSKKNIGEYNIDDYYNVSIGVYDKYISIGFYPYEDGQDELACHIKIDNRSEIAQFIEELDQDAYKQGAANVTKVNNKNKTLSDAQIKQIAAEAVAERANYLYGVDKSDVNNSDLFVVYGILRRDGSRGDGNIQVNGTYKSMNGAVSNNYGQFYIEIERDFTELGEPYKGVYEGIHYRFV